VFQADVFEIADEIPVVDSVFIIKGVLQFSDTCSENESSVVDIEVEFGIGNQSFGISTTFHQFSYINSS